MRWRSIRPRSAASVKGTAPGEDIGPRRQQRRVRRIDAANEVEMMGRCLEGQQILAADGEEDAPRRIAQGGGGRGDIGHGTPVIAWFSNPGWPLQHEARHAGGHGRLRRIDGYLMGEGMRRINQQIQSFRLGDRRPSHPRRRSRRCGSGMGGSTGATVRPAKESTGATHASPASSRASPDASAVPPSISTRNGEPCPMAGDCRHRRGWCRGAGRGRPHGHCSGSLRFRRRAAPGARPAAPRRRAHRLAKPHDGRHTRHHGEARQPGDRAGLGRSFLLRHRQRAGPRAADE